MKIRIISGLAAMLLMAAAGARASYSYSATQTFTENTAIPNGNPVGIAFAETFNQANDPGDTIAVLTISLNVSGGYNGDLYAYLVSPGGTTVVLLNQPGVTPVNPFGYAGSGLNVTLSDTAATSIQTTPETAGLVFNGTYQAAGTLSDYYGNVADGTWTLYFADLAGGGGTSTLNNWSLDMTLVPEPVNVALAIFSLLFAGVVVASSRFKLPGKPRR